MGINQITRGKARAGVLIGTVQGAAGSITSSEILAGEILSSHILAGEVQTTNIGTNEVTGLKIPRDALIELSTNISLAGKKTLTHDGATATQTILASDASNDRIVIVWGEATEAAVGSPDLDIGYSTASGSMKHIVEDWKAGAWEVGERFFGICNVPAGRKVVADWGAAGTAGVVDAYYQVLTPTVQTAQLASEIIDSSTLIAAGVVIAADVLAGQIDTSHLAGDAVLGSKITRGAIGEFSTTVTLAGKKTLTHDGATATQQILAADANNDRVVAVWGEATEASSGAPDINIGYTTAAGSMNHITDDWKSGDWAVGDRLFGMCNIPAGRKLVAEWGAAGSAGVIDAYYYVLTAGVQSDQLASLVIDSATLITGGVITGAKMAKNTITSTGIGAGAIETTNIGAAEITSAKMLKFNVLSTHLKSLAINSSTLIAANVVTGAKIPNIAIGEYSTMLALAGKKTLVHDGTTIQQILAADANNDRIVSVWGVGTEASSGAVLLDIGYSSGNHDQILQDWSSGAWAVGERFFGTCNIPKTNTLNGYFGTTAGSAGEVDVFYHVLTAGVASAQLDSLVINSATLLGAGVVTDAKRTKSVTTLTPTGSAVTAPTTSGAFYITCAGATNIVVTGAGIDKPTAGDWLDMYGEISANSSVSSIEFKSTQAKWNAAALEVLKMSGGTTKGATEYHFQARALSTTRWVLVNTSTGLTYAATT